MSRPSLFQHVTAPAPRYMLRLALLRKLFKQLLPSTPYSCLEVGPGFGDVSHFIAGDPNCHSLTLMDFSADTLACLQDRFGTSPRINYLQNDLADVESTRCYKFVMAFEVLEHVVEDKLAIEKLYSLTETDGYFLMSVPAYQRKWQKQDEYAGHVRRYERQELQDKLAAVGFVDIRVIDYGFPLTALMYPFKQASYKPDNDSSLEERSKQSGIDRPFFSRLPAWLLLPVYYPFMLLQVLFRNSELGDGFVAVARKS